MNTVVALRWLGFSGILGALLFVVGDLLYQYIPDSSKSLAEKWAACGPRD